MPEWKGGLFTFIRKEVDTGVHVLNFHNNKKHPLGKDPNYAKYESSNKIARLI